MKNNNSEFVFILNEIKYVEKLDQTQRSIFQFTILSKETRPLSFEKKNLHTRMGAGVLMDVTT